MTDEQRARSVSIAEDVLKQLNVLRITTGSFINPRNDPSFVAALTIDDDLGQHTGQARKMCDVCALGACFLSYLDVTKASYTMNDEESRWGVEFHFMEPIMINALGKRNMALIEAAFEQGCGWYDNFEFTQDDDLIDYIDDYKDAVAFGKRYPQDTDRLKAIMENIIFNRGEFTPGEVRID